MSENMCGREGRERDRQSQEGSGWQTGLTDGLTRTGRFKSRRPDRKRRIMIRVLSLLFTRFVTDFDIGFEFTAKVWSERVLNSGPLPDLQLGVARCCCQLQLERQGRPCVRSSKTPTRPIMWANWRERNGCWKKWKRGEDSCALSGDDIIMKVDPSANQFEPRAHPKTSVAVFPGAKMGREDMHFPLPLPLVEQINYLSSAGQ